MRLALLLAATACSPSPTGNDAGLDAAPVDATVDSPTQKDASSDVVDAATSFCASVDAAFCADFDLYPYVMSLGAGGQGDAGLDTSRFVSAPASAHLWAPAGNNGALASKAGTGTGTHAHLELDALVNTSGLTEQVGLLGVTFQASGTQRSFEYIFTSSAAELDYHGFADGGIGPIQKVTAATPPIGKWTHVTFDAICTSTGSFTLAFDGVPAVTQTNVDLSLPSAQTSLSVSVSAFAYNSQHALPVPVEYNLDNVVGTIGP